MPSVIQVHATIHYQKAEIKLMPLMPRLTAYI